MSWVLLSGRVEGKGKKAICRLPERTGHKIHQYFCTVLVSWHIGTSYVIKSVILQGLSQPSWGVTPLSPATSVLPLGPGRGITLPTPSPVRITGLPLPWPSPNPAFPPFDLHGLGLKRLEAGFWFCSEILWKVAKQVKYFLGGKV